MTVRGIFSLQPGSESGQVVNTALKTTIDFAVRLEGGGGFVTEHKPNVPSQIGPTFEICYGGDKTAETALSATLNTLGERLKRDSYLRAFEVEEIPLAIEP